MLGSEVSQFVTAHPEHCLPTAPEGVVDPHHRSTKLLCRSAVSHADPGYPRASWSWEGAECALDHIVPGRYG